MTSSLGLCLSKFQPNQLYPSRDGSRVSIPEVPCHTQAFNPMTWENQHPSAEVERGWGGVSDVPVTRLSFWPPLSAGQQDLLGLSLLRAIRTTDSGQGAQETGRPPGSAHEARRMQSKSG